MNDTNSRIAELKKALNEACDEILFYSDFANDHIRTKYGLYERIEQFRALLEE